MRGDVITLTTLFAELADVFDGPESIEAVARQALREADTEWTPPDDAAPLAQPFLDVLAQADAHPVSALIAAMPFVWAPPQTSADPLYVEHSKSKAHVEILGPGGLIRSDQVRIGLYGMLPEAEYGMRTHPAEEIYVMLAGRSYWRRGTAPYAPLLPGERSHHPSMMPHASRTGDLAFMSIYAWRGDISTDDYQYLGLPDDARP